MTDTPRVYFLTCHDGKVHTHDQGEGIVKGCGVQEIPAEQLTGRGGYIVCPRCFMAEWPFRVSLAMPVSADLDRLLAEPTGEVPRQTSLL